MKIRHRITLWVSLAGLGSSIVFSLIIFFWGLDSPYEFLDQELAIRAQNVVDELDREQQSGQEIDQATLINFSHLYWIRIYAPEKTLIFSSTMAKNVALPMRSSNRGYLIRTQLPLHRFYAEEGDEPTTFWNRVLSIKVGEKKYLVHVARPVESLVGESIESAIMIGASLLASTLILILVSYHVAGKILKPIQNINQMMLEITENTLGKRIPLSGNHDELDELTGSLNSMFNRLEFSFQRQKEFIANASHELKTPITLLRLSQEEILQDAQLPSGLQKKLLSQERALARISQLVKSLLDLSRLELSDQLNRTIFSFNELIASVLDEFEILFQAKQLQVNWSPEGDCSLCADRLKIRRLLINLFDNAIRYNQVNGEIRCQVVFRKTTLVLTVANTGPAIPPQDRLKVFEQFYRCEHSRATRHGGSGLGLTIVQRIVSLHRGEITILDSPPGWTIVAVEFPQADMLAFS